MRSDTSSPYILHIDFKKKLPKRHSYTTSKCLLFLQLIRVTYWTRHDRRIREDEKADYDLGDVTKLDAQPEENLVNGKLRGGPDCQETDAVVSYTKTPDAKGDDCEHVLITEQKPDGAISTQEQQIQNKQAG